MPLSILLVDDHPTFLHIARRFLASQPGVEVMAEAVSAEEALALVQEARPDVIVTDLTMPGLGGLSLIQNLRDDYPDMGVVALTLFDTKEHRTAALAAGAHAFVPKAILRTDLMHAIEAAASAAHKDAT